MKLAGLHHLTAISADAPGNFRYYTQTLGMRLVKKTVNQDDVSAYHLFYADKMATPGSDLTFFDWRVPPERRGSQSVARTYLRVASKDSLDWWAERLPEARRTQMGLEFEDPEGQRLGLIQAEGEGEPWEESPVPVQHQILGLGSVTLSLPRAESTVRLLTEVMGMKEVGEQAYAMQERPEVHLLVEPELPIARQGAGGVHHVAFRTPDEEQYREWIARLEYYGVPNSGAVDRFYFRSLYFREPNGILFEIATDGPGFTADEPLQSLGQKLALPPFLEARRSQIEAGLVSL
ncbi:MAG: ring-cleaving dioxygenase [Candidatus Eremiobacteraeota bacterium]|nr:ring-cleaving dioxygenase [Candidatus Eremiobacteraeota bacterium]